jgi:hypothetical protein
MTAEVAVLNRSAVALAADSAVTVESVQNGRPIEKVFNTANKLFTLSKYAPIGVMVYNTMSLGGVPWEVIIKHYRRDLGKTRHPRLELYCEDFLSFMRRNAILFPDKEQESVIATILHREFADIFAGCKNNGQAKAALEKAAADLEQHNAVPHFDQRFVSKVAHQYKNVADIASKVAIAPISLRGLKEFLGM